MEKLLKTVDALAEVMEEKGYGKFQFKDGGRVGVDFKTGLLDYLQRANEPQQECDLQILALTTVSIHPPNEPMSTAVFRIVKDSTAIRIASMEIDVYEVFDSPLKESLILEITKIADIPTKQEAGKIAAEMWGNSFLGKAARQRSNPFHRSAVIVWIIAAILFIGSAFQAKAQTWDEWFNQKETQRKYLLNQIAALQVYIGYARQGYQIYKNGLTFIGDMKKGEFNLHHDFFLSLKGINPEIARHWKIADIIQMQARTVKACNTALKNARGLLVFDGNEITYFADVFRRLLADCTSLTGELIRLTKTGELELEDAQRIKRIDKLYTEMQEMYRFGQSFTTEVLQVGRERMKAAREIGNARNYNGITE